MATSNAVKLLLAKLLASSYALYIKTQQFHWNVEGPLFSQLHDMFGDQYEALIPAIDELAERLRALGVKAPGSFAEFSELSIVEDSVGAKNADQMLEALVFDNEKLAGLANELFIESTKVNDAFSADIGTRREGAHEKVSWMLRATMK